MYHNIFVLSEKSDIGYNAVGKARKDTTSILSEKYKLVGSMPKMPKRMVKKMLLNYTLCKSLKLEIHSGDYLFIQFPLPKGYNKILPILNKKYRCIYLIHDLDGLRYQVPKLECREINCLDGGYKIISHNQHMTKYLIDHGINGEKIVELEIFDYLLNNHIEVTDHFSDGAMLCFAGNLEKAKFLNGFSLVDSGECINVYGLPGNMEFGSGIIYQGSYDSDTIPYKLQGKFGLVWDGTDADTCNGNLGHYMKYNNPHKISLYLSSGMPVVVWNKSAIADFVKQKHIGILVESIEESIEKIKKLNEKDYRGMQQNVMKIRDEIINGKMLQTAIKKLCL